MLKDYIESIKIIDAHEHLIPFEERRLQEVGFFDLLHYVAADYATICEIPYDFFTSKENTIEAKMKIFLEGWPQVKHTGYGRALSIALEDLYGYQPIDEKAIQILDKAIKEKSKDESWYKQVLNHKSNIEVALVIDEVKNLDSELFRGVLYFDYYIQTEGIASIGTRNNQQMDLNQYKQFLVERFKREIHDGMVALKMGIAYWRTLFIEEIEEERVIPLFNKIMNREAITCEEEKQVQDYLINYIVSLAKHFNKPIQIHTGHQEPSASGSGNTVTNSKVSLLLPLLQRHPDVKFVLLHCGFPYTLEYLSIIKNYPNAYADFSWVYIISPTAAKRLLHEAVEMIPHTRIIGFGGDYIQVELTYAHQKIARSIVTQVLEEKRDDLYLNEEEAKKIADNILRMNAKVVYKI